MKIGNLDLVHQKAGFGGTGIWPFYLVTLSSSNSKVYANSTCPICQNDTGKVIVALARNFLSVLFVPLFPLNLIHVIRCQSCNRYVKLSLPKVKREKLMSMASFYHNEWHNSEVMGTWWLPALLSSVGLLMGWFVFPLMLVGIPKYLLFPLVLGFIGWNIFGKLLDDIVDWPRLHAHWCAMFFGGLLGLVFAFIPFANLNSPTANIIGSLLGMSIFVWLYFLGTIYSPYKFNC